MFVYQQPQADKPIGSSTKPLTLISKSEPLYSRTAYDKKVQGTVVLEIEVDEQGLPQNITILKSLESTLDANAVACVKEWRFRPASRDGAPIKATATVEINFRSFGRPSSFSDDAAQHGFPPVHTQSQN
jgi:protein TonB